MNVKAIKIITKCRRKSKNLSKPKTDFNPFFERPNQFFIGFYNTLVLITIFSFAFCNIIATLFANVVLFTSLWRVRCANVVLFTRLWRGRCANLVLFTTLWFVGCVNVAHVVDGQFSNGKMMIFGEAAQWLFKGVCIWGGHFCWWPKSWMLLSVNFPDGKW